MDTEQKQFLEDLYIAYSEKIFLAAFHRTHDKKKAEEMLQEVFFIAAFKVDILFVHHNKLAWLYQVLNYVIKREAFNGKYTKDGKLREIPFEDIHDSAYEDTYELDQSQLFEYLEKILNKREYQFLLDKFQNDLSYQEISKKLGLSYSGTTSLGDRILKKVKKFLKKWEDKPFKFDI